LWSSGFSLLSVSLPKNGGINKKAENGAQHRNDIALTPIAIPMLAGPGSISLFVFIKNTTPIKKSSSLPAFILAIAVTILSF
jgi:multiple antibiotic resistance protein